MGKFTEIKRYLGTNNQGMSDLLDISRQTFYNWDNSTYKELENKLTLYHLNSLAWVLDARMEDIRDYLKGMKDLEDIVETQVNSNICPYCLQEKRKEGEE